MMPANTINSEVYDIRKTHDNSLVEIAFTKAYDASIPKEIEDYYIDLTNKLQNYVKLCGMMHDINVSNLHIEKGLDKNKSKSDPALELNSELDAEFEALKEELIKSLNEKDLPRLRELSPKLQSISARLSVSNKTVEKYQDREQELRYNHMYYSVSANEVREGLARSMEELSASLDALENAGVNINNTGITKEIFDTFERELPQLGNEGINALDGALVNYIEMRKEAFSNIEMIARNAKEAYNKRHELFDSLSDEDLDKYNTCLIPLNYYWIQDYITMPEIGFTDRLQLINETLGLISMYLKDEEVDEQAQELLDNNENMDWHIRNILQKMANAKSNKHIINKG